MTKPRPPRPVRAWAPGLPDGGLSVEQGQVPVFMSRKDAKFDCEMANDGSKPVRVTVVPDGATSAEAECRRLRREVRAIRVAVVNTCNAKGKVEKLEAAEALFHLLWPSFGLASKAALRRKGGSR